MDRKGDMKQKVLIVSENNPEALEMQGILPKIFYFFYFLFYRLQIRILIAILRGSYKIRLICARDLFPNNYPSGVDKIYYYDDFFRTVDWERGREQLINFAKSWPNDTAFSEVRSELYFDDIFLPEIAQTRFSIILAAQGVSVFMLSLTEVFSKEKPDKIIFMSRASKPEIIGRHLGQKMNISQLAMPFNLTNIDLLIKKYLRFRDRQLRKKEILAMSKETPQFPKKTKVKILLSVAMPMYLKSAVPLMKKLDRQNAILLSAIVNTEKLLAQFRPAIFWRYLFSYLKSEEIEKIISQKEQKFRKIYDRTIKQVIKDDGDEKSLYFRLAKEELRLLFYSYFPLTTAYITAFKSFLKTNKIQKAVVFSDRGTFENVVCKVCKKLRIRTIHVSPNNVMSPDASNEYNIAEIVTVPGEFMKRELVGIGHDDKNIQVVGDLKLDTVSLYKSEEFKLKVQKKYKIEEGKKNILLISWPIIPSVPYAEKEAFFKGVYESVGKIQNSQLIVKPHPNESLGTLIEHLELWGMSNTPVIQSLNLLELLAITDVMVMIWSMAAFEAIAMNVPVIAVNFAEKDYGRHIPYAEEKGVVEVTNADELYLELKSLLENRKYYAERIQNGLGFGQKYFGSLDGKAAERIAEIINKIH